MPRRLIPKAAEIHTHLGIRVEKVEARIGTGLNHDLVSRNPFSDSPKDFVFEFGAAVVFHGVAIYPPERQGEKFEIQAVAKVSGRPRLTFKDVQEHDKDGLPVYRKRRENQVPVYRPPNGLGVLERRRYDEVWYSYLFVEPAFCSNALAMIGLNRQLYLAVHEVKVERRRWIRGLSIQTTDPTDE